MFAFSTGISRGDGNHRILDDYDAVHFRSLMTEAQQVAYRVRNTDCDGTGSSFATADGIITNRHVASGSTSLQLSSWSGNDFTATPQAISEDPGADLALLSGGTTSSPAVLDPSNVPDGTHVWAAGYPEGNQLTLTPGIVVDYIDGSVYGSPDRAVPTGFEPVSPP